MGQQSRNETLNERFTRLVLNKKKTTLSEERLQDISNKLANKTLAELHELAAQIAVVGSEL